jgi:peptide methionine sulfoxide reductase MsrA
MPARNTGRPFSFIRKAKNKKQKMPLSALQYEWPNAIVTEVTAASEFYKAEDYHQAYYELEW